MRPPRPADELDHFVGPTSAWSETWEFRAATDDLSLAVLAAVTRRPAEGRVSYWAALLGRSRPTVALVEHDVLAPRSGLELRAPGLWADHVCEEPHRRWSLGLEGFALAIDGPTDLVTTGRGLPVPFGFDLEWETPDDPLPFDAPGDEGYLAVGAAHGQVQVGEAVLALEGPGGRVHRWGTGPALPEWWALPDDAGAGSPAHPIDVAAEVVLADSLGLVSAIAVGSALADDGPVAPAWSSSHVAPPVT
jgi:hypothetical protein